ncbi:MAG TPA: hypothetical protein V6C88_05710 [Chroococcidiopsis sp.]
MNKAGRLFSVIQVFGLIALRSLRTLSWQIAAKKTIYVKSWFGALGNNIIQLAQAEFLVEKTQAVVYTPPHSFLRVGDRYLLHDIQLSPPPELLYLTSELFLADLQARDLQGRDPLSKLDGSALLRSFFYRYDVQPLALKLPDYRRILQSKILPLIPYEPDTAITDETLVIHIRSGDIFQDKYPHLAYVQPPLSFYLNIIQKYNYQDVVVVTQADLQNPCVEQLQRQLPGVRVQASSLAADIGTILQARHLVVGLSTFSVALGFCSSQIRQMYVPVFDVKQGYWRVNFWSDLLRLTVQDGRAIATDTLDFTIHRIAIPNYTEVGSWKNTPKQRLLMIEHSLDGVRG